MNVDRTLKGHELFRSLGLDEAHGISDFSSVKNFHANEFVFKHNDYANHVYMMMKGSINLRLPASEKDISLVISRIEPGELFGLSPLLDSPRYTASAQCREDSEVLSIEAKPFRELLKRNYLTGFNVMNQVAHIYFERYIDVLKNIQGVVNQISMIR